MFGVLPRNQGFYQLLTEKATLLHELAQSYAHLAAHHEDRRAVLGRLREQVEAGGKLAQRTLTKLDATFVTPFDREDIHDLVERLGQVIDAIHCAARRTTIFEVNGQFPTLAQQVRLISLVCERLVQAIRLLPAIRRPDTLRQRLQDIYDLKLQADDAHHAVLADIYKCGDPIELLKAREVADLNDRAVRCCREIAVAIERIILKGT